MPEYNLNLIHNSLIWLEEQSLSLCIQEWFQQTYSHIPSFLNQQKLAEFKSHDWGENNAKAYSFEITIFFRANRNLSSIKNLLMQHLSSYFAPCPFLMNFALFTFCTLLAGTVLCLCPYCFHFQQLNSPGITVHSSGTTILCKG